MKKIIKINKTVITFFTIIVMIIVYVDLDYLNEESGRKSVIFSTAKSNNLLQRDNTKVLSGEELDYKTGVYSWDINDLLDDTLIVVDLCSRLGINEVFQEIPNGYLNNDLASAINTLQENVVKEVEISYLCGDPSWYKDSSYGKSKVDELVSYNLNYGVNYPIRKIVFDIEPWTIGISNWEEDFLQTIKEIYSYANSKEITLLLTIPFWLDTLENINNKDIYKGIIENSHGVIVMNYNRYAYDKAIDNELYYAKKNGKIIYSAAETQAPTDIYGVYDSTTYYNIGLGALRSDWKYLKNKYQYSNLGFVYHHLSSLKDMVYNVKL
ncbi:MAG: hypothetical protein Q4B63_01815 [Clostridium perfringens]|nr:hypothetical protein [Clostridium perfringens]